MDLMKALKKGDTIGIIKPSDRITEVRLKLIRKAIEDLESKGLSVRLSEQVTQTDKYGVSGGSAEERAAELNSMFRDSDIDAIWCAHGGDTVIELLDLIDYDMIKDNQKIFMGMSDIDVLHMAINKKTGMISFNTCDPKFGRAYDFDRDYSQRWFHERLFQKSRVVEPNSSWKTVRSGVAEGKIMGCNLTSLVKLAGTDYFPDLDDSILFLEGWSTDIKKAVWKLTQLKLLHVFDRIKGIVVGYVYNFDKDPQHDREGNRVEFEDIVQDIVPDLPILRINEFGHRTDSCFLPIGARARMDADRKTIDITENFLE